LILGELGPDARPALPVLRQALERAGGWDSGLLLKALRKIDPEAGRPAKGP
jgi:hypothetical protein